MEILARVLAGCVFGLPGAALIVYNYYHAITRKGTSSPAYVIGGIGAAIGVMAILGDEWKEKWYLILIPIILDLGLMIVSLAGAISPSPAYYAEHYAEQGKKVGWDVGTVAKEYFANSYRECASNKAYKAMMREKGISFIRYCCIVAGLKTGKYMGFSGWQTYNVHKLWNVEKDEFDILKGIFPDELTDEVFWYDPGDEVKK